MAGTDPTGQFNGDTFRAAIHQVMSLAAPNYVGDTPTFRWVENPTYSIADPSGNPYNWTASPSSTPTPISDFAVDCAVQYGTDSTSTTEAGQIDQVNATITLLDIDQQALVAHGGRMPDEVLLKGIVYTINFIPAPVALFDVDVFTLYCTTTDAEGGSP